MAFKLTCVINSMLRDFAQIYYLPSFYFTIRHMPRSITPSFKRTNYSHVYQRSKNKLNK